MKLFGILRKHLRYERMRWRHDSMRIKYSETKNLAILSEMKDLEDQMNQLSGKKIWLGSEEN